MLNIRSYNNKEQLLFPPSVGDYLSKDHLANVVDEAVETIDLTGYYRKISPVGNPAYDPALMIKVIFYGYCVKTYSSRKIEERLDTDVAFIYLAGMQKPDFRTISDFRKNNLKELKNSFVDILQICHCLGMTQLGDISLDSKVMKANASVKRTYDEKELIQERQELEKAIEDYLEKANKTDDEEDEKYGPDKHGNELPEDICEKESRIHKIKQIAEELKQAQEKLKNSAKEKINLTDTDSQIQKDKGRKFPGYRAEVTVDSKEQIIIANDVTNEQSDADQLLPMVEQTIQNIQQIKEPNDTSDDKPVRRSASEDGNQDAWLKIKLTADSAYSSGKNLADIQQNEKYREKIDHYIPDRHYQAKQRGKKTIEDSPFHKSKFVFHKDKNYFECPEGKHLNFTGSKKERNGEIGLRYQCPGSECRTCQHFGICTTNKKGRTIQILENDHFLEQMRQKLSTPEGKVIYGKRKTTVEPVLGNLSQNLGFREFLLRGLEKVRGEFSLMCIAHNLLKISRVVKELDSTTLHKALVMRKQSVAFDTS
jgi:transposase